MTACRLAALDLDGTLVDSAPDLAHCLGCALYSVGLGRPGLAATRSWIGDGIETLVRRGLEAGLGGGSPDNALIAETLAAFDRCYAVDLFRESRLYPGVEDTLRRLRADGIVVGCVTNKRERFARALLAAAGIEGALDFIYGGDTFARRKPDPLPLLEAARVFAVDPAEAVMVGDSVNDSEAARSAGFSFVLAGYGYLRADDVERVSASAIIENFAELGELLCGQGPDK